MILWDLLDLLKNIKNRIILVVAFPRLTIRKIGFGQYLGLVGGLVIDVALLALALALTVFVFYVCYLVALETIAEAMK